MDTSDSALGHTVDIIYPWYYLCASLRSVRDLTLQKGLYHIPLWICHLRSRCCRRDGLSFRPKANTDEKFLLSYHHLPSESIQTQSSSLILSISTYTQLADRPL
jgi:hypothetical protein